MIYDQVSVNSRWVKEELNTAVMRRISENDLRILPVLIRACEIPTPLRHIRYADFRDNHEEGLALLLESLVPEHQIWPSLSRLFDHLCSTIDRFTAGLYAHPIFTVGIIHFDLESALDFRIEIELRRAQQRSGFINLFQKIEFLLEKGIDVRSKAWNTILCVCSVNAHSMPDLYTNSPQEQDNFYFSLSMIEEYRNAEDIHELLKRDMDSLKKVMHIICFKEFDVKEA